MVNLQGVPFGPFLRGLVRARRGQRWSELKQVFRQGIAARFAARTSVSLLPRIRLWNWRRPAQPPPLFQMAAGYWVSQSIYAAVKLGIPDAMQGTPKSCREIAALTGANEHSLYRLLRVLCSIGLCKEKGDKYELTSQGRPLQSDVPGSLRSMVLTLGQLHYQAWSALEHSIKTGQPGFNHLFGTGLFQYLTENGEAGGIFNAAMTDYSGLVSYAVGLAYDFSTVRSVVDVGGGHGKFLTTILELNSHLRGTVFDLPAVIQGAKEHLAHFNGRCNAVAGDFFTSVPCGADAYVLSGVLHDWDDSSSIATRVRHTL